MKPNNQLNTPSSNSRDQIYQHGSQIKILIKEDSALSQGHTSGVQNPPDNTQSASRDIKIGKGIHSQNLDLSMQLSQKGGPTLRKLKFDPSSDVHNVTSTRQQASSSMVASKASQRPSEMNQGSKSAAKLANIYEEQKKTPQLSGDRESKSSRHSESKKSLKVMNAMIQLQNNKESLKNPKKMKMILNARLKNQDSNKQIKVIKSFDEISKSQENDGNGPTVSKKVSQIDADKDYKDEGKKTKSQEPAAKVNKKINLKTVLTNQYNETTLIEKFKDGMIQRITQAIQKKLQDGVSARRQKLIKNGLSPTLFDKQMMKERAGTSDVGSVGSSIGGGSIESKEEDFSIDFFQHYDILAMLTTKSVIASCYKLRDRKFMLKQITKPTLELQNFINVHKKGLREMTGATQLNQNMLINYIDLVKDWMDLPPQVPRQNFLNCYGLIMIKNYVYAVSDLIEDNHKLPFQVAHDNSDQIDDTPQTNKSSKTIEPVVQVSQNMYQFISSMQLGNLSSLKMIPEYYVNCILRFIIHVTRALSHAHENNIVHGNFNLSRVVAQKMDVKKNLMQLSSRSYICKGQENSKEALSLKGQEGVFSATVHATTHINYLIVNFEPWRVDSMMKRFSFDDDSIYKNAIKMDKLKLERDHYLRILKIQDLQQFGNAILELMVGKYQESNVMEEKLTANDDQVKKKTKDQSKTVSPKESIDATTPANISFVDQSKEKSTKVWGQEIGSRNNSQLEKSKPDKNPQPDEILLTNVSPKSTQQNLEYQLNQSIGGNEGGINLTESLNATIESARADTDGKTSKMKEEGDKKNQFKLLKGAVSMDSIPLNWGKHPVIGSILKILQMCIGPYGINNNFQDVDTAKILKEIHLLACEKYQNLFGELDPNFEQDENFNATTNTLIKQPDGSKAFQDRLKSSVLNNQGIMMFLTITEDTFHQLRQQTLQFIHKCFKEAIALSPSNTAAKMNKALLEWYTGDAKDEDFQAFLKNEIQPQEPDSARMMQLLFKEKIQGFSVLQSEKRQAVDNLENNFKSSTYLARYLLQHKDFVSFRNKNQKTTGSFNRKQTVGITGLDEKERCNQVIDLQKETQLQPQSIFISINDNFVGIIGKQKIIVYDTRTEKQIYNAQLPMEHLLNMKKQRTICHGHNSADENDLEEEDDESGLPSTSQNLTSNQFQTTQTAQKPNLNIINKLSNEDLMEIPKVQETKSSRSFMMHGGKGTMSNEFQINDTHNESVQEQTNEVLDSGANDLHNEGGGQESEDPKQLRSMPVRISHQTTHGQSNYVSQSIKNRQDFRGAKNENISGNLDPLNSYSLNTDSKKNIIRANFTIADSSQGEIHGQEVYMVNQMESPKNYWYQDGNIKEPIDSQIRATGGMRETPGRVHYYEQRDREQNYRVGNYNQSSSRELVREQHPMKRFKNDPVKVSDIVLHGSSESLNRDQQPLITMEMKAQSLREQMILQQKFPPVWICDVRNNGKMLALFDKAQQDRNLQATHKFGCKELMYIQNIGLTQATTQQVHILKMHEMLNNEEVLSFSFEDFDANFSTIYVQTKELYLYQIDFMQHQVLRRVDDYRHSLEMKSIFYNTYLRERGALDDFQPVKEFIDHQRGIGNNVLMPKVNNNILAVQESNSSLIKIYNIKLRQFTRQFMLCKDEPVFEDLNQRNGSAMSGYSKEAKDKEGQKLRKKQSQIEKALNQFDMEQSKLVNSKATLSPFMQMYTMNREKTLQEYKTEIYAKKIQAKYAGSNVPTPFGSLREGSTCSLAGDDQQKIKILEISPSGKLLVCTMDDQKELFIKVINEQCIEEQYNSRTGMVESKRAPFMPTYFDYDYIKNTVFDQDTTKKANGGASKDSLLKIPSSVAAGKSDAVVFMIDMDKDRKKQYMIDQARLTQGIPFKLENVEKILPGTIDRACNSFNHLGRVQCNQYQKNERLLELVQFLNVILRNPKLLMDCPLRKKNRFEKIGTVMNMIRQIHAMDFTNISIKSLLGLQQLFHFENLNFARSYQYIKSFISTTVSKNNLCALFADRKLQVYDFVSSKMLFEINAPNSGAYCLKQGMNSRMEYQKIFLLDNDNILAFQDGERRIQFIGIQAQIESFSNSNNKQASKDVTIKIEKPIGEKIDIVNDFGPLDENANDENGSDASAAEASGLVASKFLNFDEPIESVFASSNQSDLCYLALIGKLRFAIYYVQDDSMGSCDINLIWNKDYRFDKLLKSMGQIISLTFEKTCMTFVTGSQFGYICIWDFQTKQLLRRMKINQMQPCNLIKTSYFDKKIMSFCIQTQVLTVIEVKNQYIQEPQIEVTEAAEPTARIDQSKGNLSNVTAGGKGKETLNSLNNSKASLGLNTKGSQQNLVGSKSKSSVKVSDKNKESSDKTKQLEIDSIEFEKYYLFNKWTPEEKRKKGNVVQIELDRTQSFMVIVFQNKFVHVYDIQDLSSIILMREFGPFATKQIFVDEYCTYMAVLDDNQKRISYYAFHWDYYKQTIMKPSEMNTALGKNLLASFGTNKMKIQMSTPAMSPDGSEPTSPQDKKDEQNTKTCQIF